MDDRYSLMIQWSDEDECFVVTLPEFADIEIYKEDGKPLPTPKTLGRSIYLSLV